MPKEMLQLYSIENVVFLLWTKCIDEEYNWEWRTVFISLWLQSKDNMIVFYSFWPHTEKKDLSGKWDADYTSLLFWKSMKFVNTAGVADSIPCFHIPSKNSISWVCLEQEARLNAETSQKRELSRAAPELRQCAVFSYRVARDQASVFCMNVCERMCL